LLIRHSKYSARIQYYLNTSSIKLTSDDPQQSHCFDDGWIDIVKVDI